MVLDLLERAASYFARLCASSTKLLEGCLTHLSRMVLFIRYPTLNSTLATIVHLLLLVHLSSNASNSLDPQQKPCGPSLVAPGVLLKETCRIFGDSGSGLGYVPRSPSPLPYCNVEVSKAQPASSAAAAFSSVSLGLSAMTTHLAASDKKEPSSWCIFESLHHASQPPGVHTRYLIVSDSHPDVHARQGRDLYCLSNEQKCLLPAAQQVYGINS